MSSFFINCSLTAPPTLAGAVGIGGSATPVVDNGCSRITNGNMFDLCPALGEIGLINCQYAFGVPQVIRDVAGDLDLVDNTGATLLTPGRPFLSAAQEGVYTCRAPNAVCSANPVMETFSVAVHG